jgi:hypothetical protein
MLVITGDDEAILQCTYTGTLEENTGNPISKIGEISNQILSLDKNKN